MSNSWCNLHVDAVAVVRGLGGGTSKPLLVECACGSRFAVKFPNNKWRSQLLVNEFIAGLLLARLGIPTPKVAWVTFGPRFQRSTGDSATQKIVSGAEFRLKPLICLGMQFADGYSELGFGSIKRLNCDGAVLNWSDVAGAVVFDTWVFNQDARHFLGREVDGKWQLLLFDNDGAFNRHDWCLHNRIRADMNCTVLSDWVRVKFKQRDLTAFERHLTFLENDALWHDLHTIRDEIPQVWLSDLLPNRTCELDGLLTRINERRHKIRKIFESCQVCGL